MHTEVGPLHFNEDEGMPVTVPAFIVRKVVLKLNDENYDTFINDEQLSIIICSPSCQTSFSIFATE